MAVAVEVLTKYPAPAERAESHNGLLAPDRRSLTIGLVLVVTMIAFEALAVATVMPSAQRELGGLRLYGWAFTGFLLASLVGITAAGEECDRNGPAGPFIASLALFAAGLVTGGLAPSMLILVIGRVVQGLGAGSILSIAYVVIGRGYDDRLRPRLFAVMASAWIVPGLIGPAIAGALAEYASWRIVFVGLLPLVAIGGALTLPALRRLGAPANGEPRERRAWRAAQLALGVGMIVSGAASARWTLGVPLVVIGGAVALPALRRLLPEGTLQAATGLPAAVASTGLLNLAFFGAEAFVPLMVTSVRHHSAVIAGLALTSAALTWTAGSWTQERLTGRVERRTLVMAGFALVAIGIGMAALALVPSIFIAVVVVAWAVGGLGMGLAYPSIGLIVLSHADAGREGIASAAAKTSEVLGAALGAGIGGALVAAGNAGGWRTASLAGVFAITAAVALAGVFVACRLSKRAGAPLTPMNTN